jgi:aryl-alcohol dehydrogenase-like predicted oxidoreductase
MNSTKLVLGTAAFGNQYGVNKNKVDTIEKVRELALLAWEKGVRHIDTAPTYGDAEELIGKSQLPKFQMYSKFRSSTQIVSESAIISSTRLSLERLGQGSLAGLTFHSSEDLLGNSTLIENTLGILQSEGLIHSWGVSVYDPSELLALLSAGFRPNYVQAPINVLDQRFLSLNIQNLLKNNNIILQARSIFLQGLLVNEAAQSNVYFSQWNSLWTRLKTQARDSELSSAELFYRFVADQEVVDQVVLGVTNPKEILQICNEEKQLDHSSFLLSEMASSDPLLIDPRKWKSA